MEPFVKVLNPGSYLAGTHRLGIQHALPVFVKVDWNGVRLSFTGVIAPRRNGDALMGGAFIGQLPKYLDFVNEGWSALTIRNLADFAERWHLNDMRAGSPRQQEYLRLHPLDSDRSKWPVPGDNYASVKKVLASAGLEPDPQYLGKNHEPYSYGHEWLHEDVPEEVLSYLRNLPETTTTPAWI